MRTAWLGVGLLVLAGLAAGLRGPNLNLRPMHPDEAVHAYKLNELWQTGRYVYDPHEYHGPTLYYLTLPAAWLSDADNWADTTAALYRGVCVVAGVGLVLLLILVTDGLRRGAALMAGLFTALSPAMVFYSRYYIQETLLVAFTFLVIAAGWRYARSGKIGWALLAGAGIGLMHATKETAVIAWGALAVALLATWAMQRSRPQMSWRQACTGLGAAFVAIIVSAILLSGFGTNLRAPVDAVLSYSTYLSRAGGTAHVHAWDYYLRILLFTRYPAGPIWTEALIVVLAVIGMVQAIFGRRDRDTRQSPLPRFLAFYALTLTIAYALIPYKTPWCLLGSLHGMILLAGVGTITLLRWAQRRAVTLAIIAPLLIVGCTHLGVQAWRANHHPVFSRDVRNPHVYAAPVGDVERLGRYVEQLVAARATESTVVKVFIENPWPLPWYLRKVEQVGYWEAVPPDPQADIVIVSHRLVDEVTPLLPTDYDIWHYGLRRDETVAVFVRPSIRKAFERRLSLATMDP